MGILGKAISVAKGVASSVAVGSKQALKELKYAAAPVAAAAGKATAIIQGLKPSMGAATPKQPPTLGLGNIKPTTNLGVYDYRLNKGYEAAAKDSVRNSNLTYSATKSNPMKDVQTSPSITTGGGEMGTVKPATGQDVASAGLTAAQLAKIAGIGGLIVGGAYTTEQLMEYLGVRGGAGLIGKRPSRPRGRRRGRIARHYHRVYHAPARRRTHSHRVVSYKKRRRRR